MEASRIRTKAPNLIVSRWFEKIGKIWIELQRTPSTILINKEGTSGRVIFEANSCQGDLSLNKVLLRE